MHLPVRIVVRDQHFASVHALTGKFTTFEVRNLIKRVVTRPYRQLQFVFEELSETRPALETRSFGQKKWNIVPATIIARLLDTSAVHVVFF